MMMFLTIVKYLVMFAALLTAIRMYLTVNKIWKRKHEKSVAESISIVAYFLAICVHLPYMLKFAFIDKQYSQAVNDGLNVVAYFIIILIGSGLWVKEYRQHGFWRLVFKAIRLEGKESGDLLKQMIQPSSAKLILQILEKVASLDKIVSEEEKQLIRNFAKQWKIELKGDLDFNKLEKSGLLEIRQSVTDYLNTSPPSDQAAELVDLIDMVINADKIVTTDEALFSKEVKKMISNYIHKGEDAKVYYVYLVPQHTSQFEAIKELFPEAVPEERRGGKVFVRGKFFSKGYAEAICQKYSTLGIFSIWDEHKALSIEH